MRLRVEAEIEWAENEDELRLWLIKKEFRNIKLSRSFDSFESWVVNKK
jgi:hypothetical protein